MRVRRDAMEAETGVDPRYLHDASELVSEATGYVVQRNKAIVGANAFAHEAGIHQDGILKDVSTYQIIDPADVGMQMTLPLGKHSGRHAFSRACAEAGMELSREELDAAFRRFKVLADGGKAVTLNEVFEEVPA
jgi:2-isopropylmalate synthase